jgi:hypothetical protein
MKKSLITMLCGVSVFFAFSQSGYNPPGNLRQSFQKEYPQSQPTQWSHTKVGWSVTFEDRDHNNGEVTAHYDHTGRHLDTHVPYDNNDVPAPVMEKVRNKYPGSDNYAFTRIDRPGENGVYQVHLRHKKRYKTLYVEHNGQERDFHDRHY